MMLSCCCLCVCCDDVVVCCCSGCQLCLRVLVCHDQIGQSLNDTVDDIISLYGQSGHRKDQLMDDIQTHVSVHRWFCSR